MDYHAMSSKNRVDYRHSGMVLVLLLLLAAIYLQTKGRSLLLPLALIPATALAAWFRIRAIRIIIDTLSNCGNRIQKITNPLLFAGIYILAVLPTALFLKIMRKDILRLKKVPPQGSYWLAMPAGRLEKDYFSRQF